MPFFQSIRLSGHKKKISRKAEKEDIPQDSPPGESGSSRFSGKTPAGDIQAPGSVEDKSAQEHDH